MGELSRALKLDRRVLVGGAQESVKLRYGCAIRHPELEGVHELNAVRLAGPLPPDFGADDLEALADRHLAGLAHRHVVVDDGDAGERMTEPLIDRGWERRRTLFMTLRTDPAKAVVDPRAWPIDEAQLQALQLAVYREEDYGPHAAPGLVEMLARAQVAMRAGTDARRFGAGQEGDLVSMCTLYLDPDVDGLRVAMVEQVATLPLYREQGLAKAVVCAGLRAAADWGADQIVVPVDADDWPQLMYAGLGFAPLGRQVTFTLRRATARGRSDGSSTA